MYSIWCVFNNWEYVVQYMYLRGIDVVMMSCTHTHTHIHTHMHACQTVSPHTRPQNNSNNQRIQQLIHTIITRTEVMCVGGCWWNLYT